VVNNYSSTIMSNTLHKIKRQHKTHTGFTLIELLVVIAIIGLLASVVMTSLGVSRARAEIAKVLTDYKSLANSLELYRQSNGGVYPDDPTSPDTASPISITDLTNTYLTDYLKQVPSVSPAVVDISGAGSYPDVLYARNPTGTSYPRYYCGDTASIQDYVLYFTPTQQAIDSGLFGELTLENSLGDFYTYPATDAVCIMVNQK
jgi:prepilin-type N-terminal cleavage/methylation domain-containing protein